MPKPLIPLACDFASGLRICFFYCNGFCDDETAEYQSYLPVKACTTIINSFAATLFILRFIPMMLWWRAAIVPLCCEPASRCCEWGVRAGCLRVYVSRYGGVFAEKGEKMRDRSHTPESRPWVMPLCSQQHPVNSKWEISYIRRGSSKKRKCFPSTAVSFLRTISLKVSWLTFKVGGKIMDSTHLKVCVKLIGRSSNVKLNGVLRLNRVFWQPVDWDECLCFALCLVSFLRINN